MTQAIAKYAAKKMLSKEMTKYKDKPVGGNYDPFYEEIPHPKKPGKWKKVKKQVPDYIPQKEGEILAKARKRAYKLDFCLFNFLGFRFGWSSVIGLVPAIGDALDCALAIRLVAMMWGIPGHLPFWTVVHMAINILVDFLVGLVPFVGDLADAAVKANSKNVRVFEKYLDSKFRPRELQERDKRMVENGEDAPRPATVFEDFSDDEIERLNAAINNHDSNVRQPNRAYSPGRRERISDEEMGIPQRKERNDRKEHRSGRNGRR